MASMVWYWPTMSILQLINLFTFICYEYYIIYLFVTFSQQNDTPVVSALTQIFFFMYKYNLLIVPMHILLIS